MELLLGLLIAASVPMTSSGDVVQWIDSLDQSTRKGLDRSHLELSGTIELREEEEEWAAVAEYDSQVFIDGSRYDGKVSRRSLSDGDVTGGFDTRSMWDGSRYIHRQQPDNADGPLAQFSAHDVAESLDGVVEYSWGGLLQGAALGDYRPMLTLLHSVEHDVLEVRSDADGGRSMRVIESQSEIGSVEVWVDPENGTVRRISYEKGEGHSFRGATLPLDQGAHPSIVRARGVLILDEYDEVDGHMVAHRAVAEQELVFADGSRAAERHTLRARSVERNPDFDALGAFRMDSIPNGTPIENMDAPGVHFVWRDGEPVLDIGHDVVSQMDGILEDVNGPGEGTGPPGPDAHWVESPANSGTESAVAPLAWLVVGLAVAMLSGLVVAIVWQARRQRG